MKVAVLFPGQGSQYAGMADPWLDHPAGKETLQHASDVLGWDVAERSRERPMDIEDYIAREGVGGDVEDPTAPPAAGAGDS